MMCKGCIFYPYKTPTSLLLVDEEARSQHILLLMLQYQCSMKCLQSLVPYGSWYMSIQYALCVRVMVWLEYGLCPLVFFINLEYAKNDKIHDDEVDPIFHDLKQVDFVWWKVGSTCQLDVIILLHIGSSCAPIIYSH